MRKKKVRTYYEGLRLDELHTLSGTVLECMQSNDLFADLPMDLDQLRNLVLGFQATWETAKDGGSRLDKAYKDEARDALLSAFGVLATYVNQKAKGNLPILLSSGFILEQERRPVSIPGTPVLVQLLDGLQSGQLVLKFQKSRYTALYEYQYTDCVDEDGKPIWGDILVTSRTRGNVIAPAQVGVVYYARVRARNRKGISDWSSVASLLAR